MRQLALTVIIPTLNCREKLIKHIQKSQEWLPHVAEIIAIDSASTDGTWEVLHDKLTPFDANLISTDPGLYKAWNQGVSLANQPYVYFSTIGDIISSEDLYNLYNIISKKSFDLLIAPPRIIDESCMEIKSIKWPIHYITDRLPKNKIIELDEKEKILLASAFVPESIIGSSASNMYRSDILKKYPFPLEFGHQGDVAWAIKNIPNIRTGIFTSITGNFSLDGNRINSYKKIFQIINKLTFPYSDKSAIHHNGDSIMLGFLDHYHALNQKKYRTILRLNERFEQFSVYSKSTFFANKRIRLYIQKKIKYTKIICFLSHKVKSFEKPMYELSKSRYSKPISISIITPSLNQAVFATEMLASLDVQQYPCLEHIVYDAGSSDGVVDIWRKAESEGKLKFFVEPDRGQGDAINKGIRVATGEIVGWLNSDDVLLPGALHAVAEAFRLNPQAVVVCGSGGRVSRDGKLMKIVKPKCAMPGRINKAFEVVQPAMFFRRDAFWKAGGLNESLHYVMDWDLLIKLSKLGKIVAISERLADIRYYEDTKTNTGGWKRMKELAEVAASHNGRLDRNFLSFQIRDLLCKQPFKLPRSIFDHLCWNLFKDPPLMVQGWPEELSRKTRVERRVLEVKG